MATTGWRRAWLLEGHKGPLGVFPRRRSNSALRWDPPRSPMDEDALAQARRFSVRLGGDMDGLECARRAVARIPTTIRGLLGASGVERRAAIQAANVVRISTGRGSGAGARGHDVCIILL